MAGIFPSGGILNTGPFTQPTIPPTADCVRFWDCSTPLDPDAFNAILKEILNLTDNAGIPYDCSALTNICDAVNAKIETAFCDFYTNRIFTAQAQNGSISLPAGGTWRVFGFGGGVQGGFASGPGGNYIGGEMDDDDDTYVGATGGLYAGGTLFNFASIGGVSSYVHGVFAVRVDC